MFRLFLDTTNLDFCYVALYRTNDLCCEKRIPVNKNVTDIIVKLIKQVLNEQNIDYGDIAEIYLNIGPGSFTGLKVNAVIAKAWKLVYPQIKIFTASSLLLQTDKSSCISIINAKSSLFFVAVINEQHYVVSPMIVSKTQLEEIKTKYKDLPIFIDEQTKIGSNFLFHLEHFTETSLCDLQPLYLKQPI